MKNFIFIASILIVVCSCDSISERPKTPEELRLELMSQEQTQPTFYLEAEAKMKEDKVEVRKAGLFRDAEYAPDGHTIFAKITNKATIARFKDVVVTITFYSQTETPIESKEFTIYEYFEPNTTKSIDLKVYPPEAMSKFGIEVKGATPVY